ncbi:MAG: acylphosphatase [Candidatus Liptonbacteria bacterium]|nr:acylphosphatase [Candidatus Liptonbacteria bacterium]
MKHFKIIILGHVHGVGFRYSTKREADKLNLKGFVKNNSDGTVQIEVEGVEKNLEQFIAWCKKGPNSAVVKHIKVTEDRLKEFSNFKIC